MKLSQRVKILDKLDRANGDWVSMLDLTFDGRSFIANFSARISELRKLGHNIKCRIEMVDGQKQTYYKLIER